jgi:hypothetical protein
MGSGFMANLEWLDVSFGGSEDESVRASSLACRWPACADGAAAPGLVDGLQLAEQLAADREREERPVVTLRRLQRSQIWGEGNKG